MRVASRRIRLITGSAWIVVALVPAGCAAAPPLKFYTLSGGPVRGEASLDAADPPPNLGAPAIEVARVTLPAYLDTTDLVVRDGSVLELSSTGRWATRLSVAATDLLTARLAMRRPDAWVTDQMSARPAHYRLFVDISRLDITSAGAGTVEAEWEIDQPTTSHHVTRGRTQFTVHGSVTTDQGVVRFERVLLDRLADEIDISSLH
jgi:uncharacterized lipoprotein YmbA